MARCIFDGLTIEQAKVLADWFEGQGEQDCVVWFDEEDVLPPLTDVAREDGFMEVVGDDVIVHCYTP